MINDFATWYTALLRKQVEEEIQFLVTNGHQAQKISAPCMFCIDSQKGYYKCYRLDELKRFHSSIMSQNARAIGSPRGETKLNAEKIPVFDSLESPDPFGETPLIQIV